MPWTPGRQGVVEVGSAALADRWRGFDESIFSRISREARRLGAVNLAQGFPDFPGPSALLGSVSAAVQSCSNQYAPTPGTPSLLTALQGFVAQTLELSWLPGTEPGLAVTAGATEAVFCLVMGVVNPGDRVLSFEPYYESYRQAVAAAGGEFVPIRLVAPSPDNPGEGWQIDWDEFRAASALPFRCLIINTPHNPTGMSLSCDQIQRVLDACRRRGATLISDEVYEQIYFGERPASLMDVATQDDLWARVSSAAKSFGFTGFKLGWIHGHTQVVQAAMRVHEAIMFCVPTAIQEGFAAYLHNTEAVFRYLDDQRALYRRLRNKLLDGLNGCGFVTGEPPSGAYFVTASAIGLSKPGEKDVSLVQRLLDEAAIAALPISALCTPRSLSVPRLQLPWDEMHWLRFAFCKQDVVIDRALENLAKWQSSHGPASRA